MDISYEKEKTKTTLISRFLVSIGWKVLFIFDDYINPGAYTGGGGG